MNAVEGLCGPIWAVIGTWDWVALGTWALALVTLRLYYATKTLALETQQSVEQQAADSKQRAEDSKTELKVRLHLEMEKQFEGQELLAARALLASRLRHGASHDNILETVPNFFEALGILYRRGLLDNELTFNTFSFYATRWWTACKEYVAEERRRQEEDPDKPISFIEFEGLAERLYTEEARRRGIARDAVEPDADAIGQFLEDEYTLGSGG